MKDSISVLLAAYNGSKYIEAQISSILSSELDVSLSIAVGLDPSTDGTRRVLENMDEGRITIIDNVIPSGGARNNFARLVEHALSLSDRYYAFSDQDDVWDSDKLSICVDLLKRCEAECGVDCPVLIYSDSRVVDEDLYFIKPSFMAAEGLDSSSAYNFNRLIVQNVGQGCTFLFNRALLSLAAPIPSFARMHDHWFMLVASALGKIIYVDKPMLSYRQHSNNVVGASGYSFVKAVMRAIKGGRAIRKNLLLSQRQAEAFALRYGSRLGKERHEFLLQFGRLSGLGFWERRAFLHRNGVRMSGVLRNVGLYVYI